MKIRIHSAICAVAGAALAISGHNVAVVDAVTPSPSTTACASTNSCAAASAANSPPPSVFGVPKSSSSTTKPAPTVTPALLKVRGGQLHSPETVGEVDALVLNAASNGQLVVIDFTASWCGPCKMIAPLFKEMSEEIDDVVFLKVDVDENPETAAKYSVSAMPTFIFIKSGEVVDRLMGANVQRLQELIEEHM